MTIVISGGKDAARRASATAKATTLIEALPWLSSVSPAASTDRRTCQTAGADPAGRERFIARPY